MAGNGKTKPITLEELKELSRQQPYYASRAVDDVIPLGPNWLVTIRTLPSAVFDYLMGLDGSEALFQTVRFGVVGWTGFTDNKGNEVPFESEQVLIFGRGYPAVKRELMDLIPPGAQRTIDRFLNELIVLSTTEQQAVDFTQPPANGRAGGKKGAKTTGPEATSATVAEAPVSS